MRKIRIRLSFRLFRQNRMVSQDRRVSVKEKSTLTWLRKVTKKYRSFVVLLAIFEIIVSGLGVCYALVMKQMVDRAVAKDSHGFVMGMIGFGLLVLSQLAIRIITRQISEYTKKSIPPGIMITASPGCKYRISTIEPTNLISIPKNPGKMSVMPSAQTTVSDVRRFIHSSECFKLTLP